jgi:hypothetical protein
LVMLILNCLLAIIIKQLGLIRKLEKDLRLKLR